MSGKPPGLKIYRGLMSPHDTQRLLAECHTLPPPPGNPLFRYFGDFGDNADVEAVREWMLPWGDHMVGQGLFKQRPNQYRVCSWRGDLSDQFKWHIDSTRHGERILAVCLTDGRTIGFRPRAKHQEPYLLHLDAGDAYLIRATARWQWLHRVMPTGQGRGGGESFVISYKRPKASANRTSRR